MNVNDEFTVVKKGLTVVGCLIDSLPARNAKCIANSKNDTPRKSPVAVRYGIHTLSGSIFIFQTNITNA